MRLVLLVFVFLAGCRTASLPVVPSASLPATVDGDVAEWAGGLRPVPGQPGLSVGVRRDGGSLVVAVVAGAEWQARRIAGGGLTVWLDPDGGTARSAGVRFPVGVGGPPVVRGAVVSAEEERALRDAFATGLGVLETVRGREASPVAVGGVAGVETAAVWAPTGLAVEVRLGAAFAGAGETLSVGLELAALSDGPDGPAAPSLTRTPDRRVDYGADQRSRETAAPPTETRFQDTRTETTWLRVTR